MLLADAVIMPIVMSGLCSMRGDDTEDLSERLGLDGQTTLSSDAGSASIDLQSGGDIFSAPAATSPRRTVTSAPSTTSSRGNPCLLGKLARSNGSPLVTELDGQLDDIKLAAAAIGEDVKDPCAGTPAPRALR